MHIKPLFRITLILTVALLATLIAASVAYAQEPVPPSSDSLEQVAGVPGAKAHAFDQVRGHIHAVVPVGALQQKVVVLADIEEGDEMMDEDMLEDAALIEIAFGDFQGGAL